MNIVKEINQFYRILATECPKYKNICVTTDELKDDFILSEVLYDLEDNIYVYEGAEDLYHKVKRYANKKVRICNATSIIGVICMIIGGIIVLGTAGSSDLGTISMRQIISQIAMGLSISTIGYIIIKIINKVEE